MAVAKRHQSEVWGHFLIVEEGPHKPKCRHCQQSVSRGPAHYPQKDLTNTSLWKHLEKNHPNIWKEAKGKEEEFKEAKRKKIEDSEKAKNIYVLANTKQTTLVDCLQRSKPWKKESNENVSYDFIESRICCYLIKREPFCLLVLEYLNFINAI